MSHQVTWLTDTRFLQIPYHVYEYVVRAWVTFIGRKAHVKPDLAMT